MVGQSWQSCFQIKIKVLNKLLKIPLLIKALTLRVNNDKFKQILKKNHLYQLLPAFLQDSNPVQLKENNASNE